MLKTIANASNNTLAKSIADTNINSFVTILFTFYSNIHFFHSHVLIELIE